MAAHFVKVLFGNMGNFHFLIAVFFAEFPDEIVQGIPKNGSFGRPKQETGADEIGKMKRSKAGPSILWSRLFASSRIFRYSSNSFFELKARP